MKPPDRHRDARNQHRQRINPRQYADARRGVVRSDEYITNREDNRNDYVARQKNQYSLRRALPLKSAYFSSAPRYQFIDPSPWCKVERQGA